MPSFLNAPQVAPQSIILSKSELRFREDFVDVPFPAEGPDETNFALQLRVEPTTVRRDSVLCTRRTLDCRLTGKNLRTILASQCAARLVRPGYSIHWLARGGAHTKM